MAVVVVADETSDDAGIVHRLVTQWAENEHRIGLSNGERVDVIGLLSAFGITPTQIARRTRTSKADVTAALAPGNEDVADYTVTMETSQEENFTARFADGPH